MAGFSYAAEKIVGGYKTTQFVEKDPYCQSVLRKNFPNIPIHDDIKTFTAKKGQFDVFTIGFPCQDLSVAGRQEALEKVQDQDYSTKVSGYLGKFDLNLPYLKMLEIYSLTKKGQTFQEVLFQIAKAGYDAEWSVISAKDVGACHLRERIWIVYETRNQNVTTEYSNGRLSDQVEFDENLQNLINEDYELNHTTIHNPKGQKQNQINEMAKNYQLRQRWIIFKRGYESMVKNSSSQERDTKFYSKSGQQ